MKKAKAVKYFGSQAGVARALDITDAAVWQWGDIVPFDKAVLLNRATAGGLKVVWDDYQKNGKPVTT